MEIPCIYRYTRSSTINNESNASEYWASEKEIHKPVAKVDSGIEQDAPPLGNNMAGYKQKGRGSHNIGK